MYAIRSYYAALLPDGRQLLFAVEPRGGTGDDRRIETQDLLI